MSSKISAPLKISAPRHAPELLRAKSIGYRPIQSAMITRDSMPSLWQLLQDWLRGLRDETWPAIFGVFSAASTLLTFSPALGLGRLRLISGACLGVAFGWANFNVYRKHSARIRELETTLVTLQSNRARLVIHPGDRTRYVLLAVSEQERSHSIAMYVEFDLAIENKGNRHSTVKRYDLEIQETGKHYDDIKPYSCNQVYGRHSSSGTQQPHLMTAGGFISIETQKMTVQGFLPFRVEDLPPMDCSQIHCRLILTDTEDNQASHDFVVGEQ